MPPHGYRSIEATQRGLLNLEQDTSTSKKRKTSTTNLFTQEDVSRHENSDDCWVIYKGSVYDITNFLEKHPGGAELILDKAGKDITDLFEDDNFHNHSSAAHNLLRNYKIGKLKTIKNEAHEIPDEFSMDGWMEDELDWDKGMVWQVHRFGPNYMKWCNSPVDRPLRLFDYGFVEFFSKTPWYMIPIIWIPVILILSYFAILELYTRMAGMDPHAGDYTYNVAMTVLAYVCSFCVGVPVWTLMEYMLHRFLFHLDPKQSPILITLHFFLHGQHHKVPFDQNRLVFPPIGAAFLAFVLSVPFTQTLPGGYGLALFAGGLLGYVIYDLTHYYLHHGTPERGSYLHSLKYYHVLHHFDDHSTGYGISTKFWDYPFSTVNKKSEK